MLPRSIDEFAALSPNVMCTLGGELRIDWVSPAVSQVLGWSADEIVGRPFRSLVLAQDVPRVHAALAQAQRSPGDRRTVRCQLVHRDGHALCMRWTVRCGQDGLVYGVGSLAVDEAEHGREVERQALRSRLAQRLVGLGHWYCAAGGDHVQWCDQVFAIHGRDPALGQPSLAEALDAYHPEDRAFVAAAVRKAREGGTFDFARRIVRPDGEVRILRAVGAAERDATGAVTGIHGVCQDVTAMAQARRRAEEGHGLLELFLEHAPLVLWRFDGDTGLHTEYRGQGLERFALPSDRLVGVSVEMLYAHRPGLAERLRKIPQTGEPVVFESVGVSTCGASYCFWTIALPDPSRPGSVVGIGLDKTEHWIAAREERAAYARSELLRRRLETAFEAADVGLWEWDVATDEVLWSRRLEEILGVEPGGRRDRAQFDDRLHPEDREAFAEHLDRHLKLGEKYDIVYRVRPGPMHSVAEPSRTPDEGEWRWCRSTGKAIRDARGDLIYMVGATEDITDRRRAMEELRIAAEQARAGSRAKSQFIANVSHEIRTPMNAILGLTELLLTGGNLDDGQREHLTDITNASHVLLRLIGDVLDLSRAEAGALGLRSVPYSLSNLLGDQARLHRGPALRKGIALHLDTGALDACGGGVLGDPDRTAQIVGNLLGNAVKFTQDGSVTLRVARCEPVDGELSLRIEIEDTGPGIPAAKRRSIFGVFEQLDDSNTRIHGGAGLGLAISHQLTTQMGGGLWVEERRDGTGSVFVLELRLPTASLELSDDRCLAGADVPDGLRVLLVEDNVVNRKVAIHMLERLHCEVVCAEHGQAGVERFTAEAFDLVLMDVQMPVMDGLSATRSIRALGGRGLTTPIVGLTAHASQEDRLKCLMAGMDERITKPMSLGQLGEVLARHAGSAFSEAS